MKKTKPQPLPLPASEYQAIADHLASDKVPEGTLTLNQLRGFLFAVASSPTALTPGDWLPVIWGSEDDLREPADGEEPAPSGSSRIPPEAEPVLPYIVYLFGLTDRAVKDEAFKLPADCVWSEDAEVSRPLREWCQGLMVGHGWLEDVWTEALDEMKKREDLTLGQEVTAALAMPTLFADVEAALAKAPNPEELRGRLPQIAATILPNSLGIYARIGRELLRLERLRAQNPEEDKIGRNDPCPCGSGKKFKKCCGA